MLALHSLAGDNKSLINRISICLLCLPALLGAAGCSNVSWPWSRHHDAAAMASPAPGGNDDAQCAQLRADIKNNEERSRNATTQSTSPEIVAATEAKAGAQIDALRARYDALDCPGEADPHYRRAPVTPAPGGPQP